MSARDILNEIPRLTAAERRLLLEKLQEVEHAENLHLHEGTATYGVVNLQDRGIGEAQAGDLRSRLATFAVDWDRPEALFTMKTRRGDVVLVLFPNSDLRTANVGLRSFYSVTISPVA